MNRIDVVTPLEKAAYAAAIADGMNPECDSWVEWMPVVKAVLLSLKEIDWVVCRDACYPIADTVPYNPDPKEAFSAMIDAILADGGE